MLAQNDFEVFIDFDIEPGQDFRAAILNAIVRAANNGYFVQFLSRAFLASQWAQAELQSFLQLQHAGGRCILVDLEDVSALLPAQLKALKRITFYGHDMKTNSERILQALGIG
jgi:hypothetical protein